MKDRLAYVSLTLLVILLLSGSCEPSTIGSTPTVRPASTPTPTLGPTPEGWKTYRSQALNFSIAYPPTWEVGMEGEALVADERFGEGPEPLYYFVYFAEYPNSEQRSFEEVVTADLSAELQEEFTFTERMIGGERVYETTMLPARSGALTVLFEGDDRYLAVALTPHDPQDPWVAQPRYETTFERMLKTFRFENPAP
ncbi:MAG: hypothetical protein ACLFU8_02210 [Anaerolineales bacterium]